MTARLNAKDVGYMDLDRWLAFWRLIGARVELDGVDVTDRCIAFAGNFVKVPLEPLQVLDDGSGFVVDMLCGRVEVVIP